MARYFNVAGPCNEAKHYIIDSSLRLRGIADLIDQEQYFVIHAARQSGKTTFLLDMVRRVNAEGKYYAFRCSLEMGQGITDPEKGIPAIVNKIKLDLEYSKVPGGNGFAAGADLSDYANVLRRTLTGFCMSLDRPLVIFFDEADCLSERTLISFLRQLRDGHNARSET
ncbi:MAG: ATP-binding protein, partial [Tannerella sp.]|nr:ATP-binding protein [Tannerella sp.]